MNLNQSKSGIEGGSNQEQEEKAIFKQGRGAGGRKESKGEEAKSEEGRDGGSHWGAEKGKRALLEGIDAGLNV